MTDMALSVAHVITELPIGGAQDNTLLTVERLDRGRFVPTLISSPSGGYLERVRLGRYRKILTRSLVRPANPVTDVCALWRLIEIFSRGNGGRPFDIVHTHSSKAGFLGRIAARMAGCPVVVHTVHGWPFNNSQSWPVKQGFIMAERATAAISDCIVTVCETVRDEAISLGIGSPGTLRAIYSGMDFSPFDAIDRYEARERIRSEFRVPPGGALVGMVARLFPQKAPLLFLDVAASLLVDLPDTRFIFVGDGPMRQEFEAGIIGRGLKGRVIAAGWRSDIAEILTALDVFLLTSLWEGLGRAITEAAYCGVPIVASKVNGVPEVVRDGETGFLFDSGDTDAAAALVRKILTDFDLAVGLSRASTEKIRHQFSIDRMVREIEELYLELLDGKGVGDGRRG